MYRVCEFGWRRFARSGPPETARRRRSMFDRLISYFAKQNPHSIAIVSLTGQQTYAEFDANINRVADALEEKGLPKTGLTGVAVGDQYVHWLLLMALARLG